MEKHIIFLGQPCILACDGQCNKAWGLNARPKAMLSDDEDDFVFLADDALGEAPADPGTYEGGQGKPSETPLTDPGYMNKWCARECERSRIVKQGEPIVLRDMKNPRPNRPSSKVLYT